MELDEFMSSINNYDIGENFDGDFKDIDEADLDYILSDLLEDENWEEDNSYGCW